MSLRVSALLRRHNASELRSVSLLAPAELEKEAIARMRIVEAERQGGATIASDQQLTFESFTRGVADGSRRMSLAIENIQPAFLKFIGHVREMVGDGRSDELHMTAMVVYRALSQVFAAEADPEAAAKFSLANARKALEKYFGSVSTAVFNGAAVRAKEMYAWKKSVETASAAIAANAAAAAPQPAAAPAASRAAAEEYGAGFAFVDPLAPGAASLDAIEQMLAEAEAKIAPSRLWEAGGIWNPSSSKAAAAPAEAKAPAAAEACDSEWLRRHLEPLATFTPSGEPLLTEEQLASSVLKTLQSAASDDHIQNDLVSLLGFDHIELVIALIQNRKRIVEDHKAEAFQKRGGPAAKQRGKGQPVILGVTVKRESQLDIERRGRKEGRHFARMTERTEAAAPIDQSRLDDQSAAIPIGPFDPSAVSRTALPEGTTRTHGKGFEEVYVPPVRPRPIAPGDLVPTSEMDEFAQLAFKDTPTLNRIQSAVFEIAYRSNTNMLICAPTGAGKTNIAMLAVVHEIGQHLSQGVLGRDMFKIVYVAPMKALVQEVCEKFSQRLGALGIQVRELTGDMQLTKREIKETHMIVTTPEKWDVVTRKSGDGSIMATVRLLIIDEVHLLHEERGSAIEILVARTLRQVESSQQMCRIVGLSATLPNYADVATFLRVDPKAGLFFFGNEYRPVPLHQHFVGVTDANPMKRKARMNELAWEKALHYVKQEQQVMIFVHSRRDTVKTAEYLQRCAAEARVLDLFEGTVNPKFEKYRTRIAHTRTAELRRLLPAGFAVHHAGMVRSDRTMVENMFKEGLVQVLVCTATLAWGVNLPAHAVVIKGTQIYDPKRGGYVELGMLDVMQIFGRAGRPQYDTTGEAIILTDHDQLQHYLSLLNHQMPIESKFEAALPDHLNAEIILGTVSNVNEAVEWLGYTYMYHRMLRNGLVYGITSDDRNADPLLLEHRRKLILQAAGSLGECQMARLDRKSGNFFSTDLGRVASHYYVHHESVDIYNKALRKGVLTDEEVIALIAGSKEFQQIKLRAEELNELNKLVGKYCPVAIKGGVDGPAGKANVLLQTYISQGIVEETTLISDTYYITQSAGRITRALFEMAIKQSNSALASQLLTMCKVVEHRIWPFQHPLRQFPALKQPLVQRLEEAKLDLDRLADMSGAEIGQIVRQQKIGPQVKKYVRSVPYVHLEASALPITREVLTVKVTITADFDWHNRLHGAVQPWWIWCEDPDNHIYHQEYFTLEHKTHHEPHTLTFTIPIREPLPPQYYIRAISDRWLGSESECELSFKHLFLPLQHPPHTKLLNLHPLPVTALHNPLAERMYPFTHFNPIQTQAFHTLYHTDHNVLMGAPTGSGKTIVAEITMLRLWALAPGSKVVYIAPMKALARERIADWNSDRSLKGQFGVSIVELTGDSAPDALALKNADVIITTPEKWDGISRSWRTRSYVKHVGLVIIDEIHLLGEDRGPTLETIVSRMRYISTQTESPVRLVGLSTALSNCRDLADWLGVPESGLFNFEPNARPVPLTVHVAGYPGKHYCPRMATMNKPTYAAIMTYSPDKPVLVFVSSRRQTRLTAMDLISFTAADGNSRKFLRLSDDELQQVLAGVRDPNLKHCLSFGIGMHHAGLTPRDRATVEELFVNQKIMVLVCTSTLAWGVNFPAHLVVVKGTEYYDAKTRRYVDFPITDVLQMMGRAGRPQFDRDGKACVLVHEPKKNFYLKFLHHPFPVESSLHKEDYMQNAFNAEIVGGTIASVQDAVEYMSWTFYFRRLLLNPSYYGLESATPEAIHEHVLRMVRSTLHDLVVAGCAGLTDDDGNFVAEVDSLKDLDHLRVAPRVFGQLASVYYLKYSTMQLFSQRLARGSSAEELLDVLCCSSEYKDLPLRHNEDKLNEELAKEPGILFPVDEYRCGTEPGKASLLFQAHFSRTPLPISDYVTDTMSVLDQAIRILQAMVDVCAESGWLRTCLRTMNLVQMVVQGRWMTDNSVLVLPHANDTLLAKLWNKDVRCLPQLLQLEATNAATLTELMTSAGLTEPQRRAAVQVIRAMPVVTIRTSCELVRAADDEGPAEWSLTVRLQRSRPAPPKAYAPKFSKPKLEGWWLVLGACRDAEGETEDDQLLALQRVALSRETKAVLKFKGAEPRAQLTLYLVSDSYIGLDQQVRVALPQ